MLRHAADDIFAPPPDDISLFAISFASDADVAPFIYAAIITP